MPDKYFTIEEIVALPQLHSPDISNDGRRLAFVRRLADWDENEFRSHVWVYEVEDGSCYPITRGKDVSSSPAWSPDSTRLAYKLSVGEGDDRKDQIHIQQVGEGQGVQVSYAPEGVADYEWSPDGKGFFFTSPAPEPEGLRKRKEMYGDFEYVDEEYRRHCLYYLDLRKGLDKANVRYTVPKDVREAGSKDERDDDEKARHDEIAVQLTDGVDLHVQSFAVSPDGKQAVLSGTPSPNLEDSIKARLYLLDVESHDIEDLGIGELGWATPRYSPDGTSVAYTRYPGGDVWLENQVLETLDLESRQVSHPLIKIDEDVMPVRWTEKGILVWWQERTNASLALLSSGGMSPPVVEKCPVRSATISRDGEHVAYLKASSTEPFDLYLDGKRITSQYEPYRDHSVSRKELVQWRSQDGTEIEGVLSTPPDFDASRKYPLLLVIHGGPTGTSIPTPTDQAFYPIEQFVEKGFVVLEPNYRGSAGYGEAFRRLNYRDLGIGDYADVISGVDALVERSFVDTDRVGVMGWSQGGYISAFCATYSDRFKAISVGAGISNWITYYVNTDIHQFTRIYLGKTPWDDLEVYKNTSPMTYIKSARTPTLIQHGDQDSRVPLPNAYELYQGLRDEGVETRLIVYKGMQHGPNKPGQCRAIMKQNLFWFSHHILGEKLDGFYLYPSE